MWFSHPRSSTLSARRRLDRPDTYAAPKASRLPDSSPSHTFRTLLYLCPPAVLKVRLSFAQNSWCDFSSCMLTPRITAFFASNLARVPLKIVGFDRAPGGHILRIEIEHHPLALELMQADGLSLLRIQCEGRERAFPQPAICLRPAGSR